MPAVGSTIFATMSIRPLATRLSGLLTVSAFLIAPVLGQTLLTPGDLAIVGINANNSCIASTNDEISFVCFKDISQNTRFIITDCGYQTQNAGLWGDNEGVVQLWYTGVAPILKGTVITIRQNGAVTVVSPAGSWTITNLNAGFNLNSLGEQMFILQPFGAGPYWVNPAGTNNASFNNCTLLYAFNTKTVWTPYTYTGAGTCPGSGTCDSDLPPGSLCFSMNPTSTSDFVKFTDAVAGGTFAPRTQRAWIVDIDNAANWTPYGSCALYNSSIPNYAGGYSITVSPGTFTNGLWTGAKSTDWFDCRNWDDAEVPISTSNVLIDQTAIRNCDVATTGQVAVCDTLNLQTSSTARTLTINNTSSLVVGGPVKVTCTAGAGATLAVTSGSFTSNSLALAGTASLAGNAVFRNEVNTNTVNVQGPLTINSGGLLDLQGSAQGGNINLSGNWTNNDGETVFQDTLSTVSFVGSGPQTITTAGSVVEFFNRIVVNKPAGDVTLNAPVRVRTAMNLNNGRVFPNTNDLILHAGSGVNAVNPASFVHGPMIKIGNTDFDFPIGKGTRMRKAGMWTITGTTADAFKAEYFPASPRTTFNNVLDPTLDHISDCEYWIIERWSGTPDAYVKLTWEDPYSCGVTLAGDLRVARWNGTLWENKLQSNLVSTPPSGSLMTGATQTQFSPWTLASTTAQNPLPIELLSFTGRALGEDVRLDWATASEVGNDHFTVERSTDLTDWIGVADVDGAGDSQEELDYTAFDTDPLLGVNFYRLRQTDVDGNSTLSGIVSVTMEHGTARPITVFTDGTSVFALHDLPVGSDARVLDPSGRTIVRTTVRIDGVLQLSAASWPHGIYLLRLSDGARVVAERFAY